MIVSCIILFWIVIFFCMVSPPFLSGQIVYLFNGYILTQIAETNKSFIY